MEPQARSPLARLVVMLTACTLAFAGFVALGTWQVKRLAWKEALIARVERNAQAAPVPAPDAQHWGTVGAQDEYRRVQEHGRLEYEREVLVSATTELGQGYWVLTPLQTQQGAWVLVNRGFVPPELRGKVPQAALQQTVTGLLRLPEPGGRPLQKNDPAAGRWYSRDVAAIAAAQRLPGSVAPYFIDLVATPGATPEWPRAGLTVLRFRNDHLVYALTWFALAAIMAAAIGYVLLDARRSRVARDAPC
jgi:surfeit locus 1 family protein